MSKEKHATEFWFSPGDLSELADWASRAPHPFTLPEKVMQALNDKENSGNTYVDHSPDSNFFAVTSYDGMKCPCISSTYFTVENGRAGPADGPKNWDGEEGVACGLIAGWGPSTERRSLSRLITAATGQN